jgi:hypothetical protein
VKRTLTIYVQVGRNECGSWHRVPRLVRATTRHPETLDPKTRALVRVDLQVPVELLEDPRTLHVVLDVPDPAPLHVDGSSAVEP